MKLLNIPGSFLLALFFSYYYDYKIQKETFCKSTFLSQVKTISKFSHILSIVFWTALLSIITIYK